MQEIIRFIGLDVHKDFIFVAIADEGRGEVTSCGEVANTPSAVSKLARKLSRHGCDLCFVYEAGCFGFVLYRQLTKMGHSCVVAAPSLVPSEYSSGGKRKQGAITKVGNGHARRILVESGWNYRFPARLTRHIERQQRGLSKEVTDMACTKAVVLPLSEHDHAGQESEVDDHSRCQRAMWISLGYWAAG
jgi:transposase